MSSSLWAAAAQNSIGNKQTAGIAPGAFSAIAPARSFGDLSRPSGGTSVFDAPSGSNDFDMSGLESEAAVLGGGSGQNAFGAARPVVNAFGGSTSFSQPNPSSFPPSSQPSANAFGQPSQRAESAYMQPSQGSTNAFGQPTTSSFSQARPSAFGPGGSGMATTTQSAFGPGRSGVPSAVPAQTTSGSAFGPGGMGPPSGATMTFGRPAQSTFGQPAAPPPMTFGTPAQSTFGQPTNPSVFPQYRSPAPPPAPRSGYVSTPVWNQPAPAVPGLGQPVPVTGATAQAPGTTPSQASLPRFGSAAPTPNTFGSAPSPAAMQPTTPAFATSTPSKEVTDAFFKTVFAKKTQPPATPPSVAAFSSTPANTPPAPSFGKAVPPSSSAAGATTTAVPLTASDDAATTQAKANAFFSGLFKKSESGPVASTPKIEEPIPAPVVPSTPVKGKSPATVEPSISTTPPGPPPASKSKEEAKTVQDHSNALAAFAMKAADKSSSELATLSLGNKAADAAVKRKEAEQSRKTEEAAAVEAEGKSAEAFKAFRTQDPFERFKTAPAPSWLDAPREKADWEIKLDEARKKREAAGAQTEFDNSAFTSAQIEERRRQRAEEHQLEHDDSDEEEGEEKEEDKKKETSDTEEKEEKFPEEKLTSKEPVQKESSAAKPTSIGTKLDSNLLGLSLGSPPSKELPVSVGEKSSPKAAEISKPASVPSTGPTTNPPRLSPSPTAIAAQTSGGSSPRSLPPISRPPSAFAPIKSSPLATATVVANEPIIPAKAPSTSLSFNLGKKAPANKPPASSKLDEVRKIQPEEVLTPSATLPLLGQLSLSTSKEGSPVTKPAQPLKPNPMGGWPEDPVPKFRLETSVSPDSKVESTSRELEKARLAIDEGLRQIRATVEKCRAYHELLKKPSPNSKGLEQLTETKRWNFADLNSLKASVNDVLAGTGPLRDKTLQYRRASLEIDSLVLKAETKKEECARFKRAHDDKDFESIMRVPHLGPEQSENQAKLRHGSLLVHNQIERLEDYVAGVRAKVVQRKNGVKPLTGPTLDTVNRTIRNLDTAAATELITLQGLNDRLQGAKRINRAHAPLQRGTEESMDALGTEMLNLPSTTAQAQSASAPSTVSATRLKQAFLATRITPLVNTMASQFATARNPAILETDLSLALYSGPLTLHMALAEEELGQSLKELSPLATKEIQALEAPQSVEQATVKRIEVKLEGNTPIVEQETETTAVPFNISGPLPAGWEAWKNAPYKPLTIDPSLRTSRRAPRHALSERSALKSTDVSKEPAHGTLGPASQSPAPIPNTADLSANETGSSASGAPKPPIWPSLIPATSTVVPPLGSIPPLARKDFLGSLPPVKKDNIPVSQPTKPISIKPTVFMPLMGKQTQVPTAEELRQKAQLAWGNLGSSSDSASKDSASKPSLSWDPSKFLSPASSSLAPAAPLQIPAAWKAVLSAPDPTKTPSSGPGSGPPSKTAIPVEEPQRPENQPSPSVTLNTQPAEGSAKDVQASVRHSSLGAVSDASNATPMAVAAQSKASHSPPLPKVAPITSAPSISLPESVVKVDETKTTPSKAFDFASLTKNAVTSANPGAPSFSELVKISELSSSTTNAAPKAATNTVAEAEAPKTPPPRPSPNLAQMNVRSPPLQAMFGSKSSSSQQSVTVSEDSTAPLLSLPPAPMKSAFGPGGSGMASSPNPSASSKSAFGPSGFGLRAPRPPATTTGSRSAFGSGGSGAPTPLHEDTNPPGIQSPTPAPVGGTFGMHSGGASGAFAHSSAPRSIFAKPEGWTSSACSNNTGNVFKPVTVVPTSSSQSGSSDWAKRFGHLQNATDEEEEDADGDPDPSTSHGNYSEVDYRGQATELSDLEEAEEEYEVVDE
ncbi:hypothetical protein DACRYDRAFT_114181 [Dacryopinax primogenitus]|uniref:Uncharacterized protein n=1 Tax=Dacryopinax primogenitus (strain DJM 731) TaxID=1858805 RepID=M5GG47_DACPD|nr:uncharacterized protein DACRYDRAFT_114181 [Dacryopinax primogenitus]EJU04858.1 hypothetical protein DACRYDRAFT_114181 [Dacryopinax primogenitus]